MKVVGSHHTKVIFFVYFAFSTDMTKAIVINASSFIVWGILQEILLFRFVRDVILSTKVGKVKQTRKRWNRVGP